MIATHSEQAPTVNRTINLISDEKHMQTTATEHGMLATSSLEPLINKYFLPSRVVVHPPQAGLNPLADAAGYLFSIIGKLKQISFYRQLSGLQKELVQEVNQFLDTIKHRGYTAEYHLVCRYLLCATLDDVITNTTWGSQGQWEHYCLLAAFNQDLQHHDKLFGIIERAINDPATYIDLMEFIYICLSLGYKGPYRATEYSQYQLEQITNNLYKHIRCHRGNFSKILSPNLIKPSKPIKQVLRPSQFLLIFFTTACIIMSIFVSLGYLTDVISNEVYKNITQIETPGTHRA